MYARIDLGKVHEEKAQEELSRFADAVRRDVLGDNSILGALVNILFALDYKPYSYEDKESAYSEVIAQFEKITGYVPVGTKDLLNILSHPDMIDKTRAFLDACEANG